MLRNGSTSNKEKELQKSFAVRSGEVTVAFRSTVGVKAYLGACLSPPSSIQPSVHTDRKRWVESTHSDRDTGSHLKVPDTLNLSTYCTPISYIHLFRYI